MDRPDWVEDEQGVSRDRSDPAMTPDTRMVTDAEAAAWRKRYTDPGSGAIYSARIVVALLADRERLLGLARLVGNNEWVGDTMLLPDWIEHIRNEARKLLREAHDE